MSKDPNNNNPSDSDHNPTPDLTVDLDAQLSQDRAGEDSTDRNSSVGENLTSIEISNFDQTMDLTPSNPSLGSGTVDVDQANDQTMDLESLTPRELDGTMMISPSMAPFQGKVFSDEQPPSAGSETRILGAQSNDADQTMELSQFGIGNTGGAPANPSEIPDATMLLSDSQNGSNAGSQLGSQSGSSSVSGKSSYDQTMDLSDSASDSKGVSEARSLSTPSKTGQSVPATGKSGFKSLADSRQYLQADRAKASDAFLDRVTERKISYTIDWNDVSADYQVNKKVDPKSGKLDLHVLGKGGMGLVYLATQNSVNRPVALKVIRKDKQTEAFSKQFFYEAEITAMLEHPNITPIYELGRSPEGTFFYSMKYIQGTPWEKKIRENTIEENLEIFDKLCDAIGFAHSKNIIHMDIKPDNVQLGEYGEVYAVDWGVASNLKRPESIRCAGTWQWISPEVSRGERDKIGKGSDIYLLGGVLFLIVTGHHPRLPKDPTNKMGQAGLTKAAQGNIIQPTDCKDPMVAVALKALSTEPKDRFARVEDLQEAIHKIQKQRANIKSSQELTVRSVEVGAQAQELGDYDRFNRSLFGLRDAIELWEQNPDAPGELKKVRLAYGQCAFDKGDYDLALQTLDRSDAIEDDLYRRAEDAQTANKLRAQRFRFLRNLFIFSLIGLSSVIVFYYLDAQQQKAKAEENEKIANENAEQARDNAEEAKRNAEEAKRNAKTADDNALEARKQAVEAARQQKIAEEKKVEAEERKIEALAAKAKAEEQLAKTQLTDFASRLGLARSRIQEANPTGAEELLEGIRDTVNEDIQELADVASNSSAADKANDPDSPPAKRLIAELPSPSNWAQRRLELLANSDLEGMDLTSLSGFKSGQPALAIDQKDSSLIAAYPSGEIYKESFDASEAKLIWSADRSKGPIQWPKNSKVRRVVPSRDSNLVYLALMDADPPFVSIDLETNEVKPLDRDIKKVGDRLALSPVSRHIATTQPGYIWFTKNSSDFYGNAVPAKNKTVQLKWLTDDLLLALIENNGIYHLMLVAPFVGTELVPDENGVNRARPTFIQYTATLEEDIVQFELIDAVLPKMISDFKVEQFPDLKVGLLGQVKSEEANKLFAEMIESLHFVVGQSDGNLIQTQFKRMDPESKLQVGRLTRNNPYTLPRKHLHKIEEIVVEGQPETGSNIRRVLTRAQEEQAVQVWALPETSSDKNPVSNLGISHLHALTGGAFKDEKSAVKTISFTGFDKDGKVVLVNSEWKAYSLDVQEQMDRKRIALEVPFDAAAFLESTAKWLFKHGTNGQVLSVDGYGGVALYDSNKQPDEGTGKRLPVGPQESQMKLRFWTDSSVGENEQTSKGVTPLTNFQYWGHSPFAQIQHVALCSDGKRAISLADIPGSYAGYLIPRHRNAKARTQEYKEICLWDLDNQQMLDRMIFESKDSIDRLSILDDLRFVLGNAETFSLIDIDPDRRSIFQEDMKETAVQFCVPNPIHPYHAFFRADNDSAGTCWIGAIPFDNSPADSPRKWLSPDENFMTLDQGLSLENPKGAPVAGCWSLDGLRLYVLDKSYQIHKFQLDAKTGTLSKTFGPGSPDLLKPDSQVSLILSQIAKQPEKITMGMVRSSSSPEAWSDTLYFDSVDLPEIGQVAHATFSSAAKAQWSMEPKISEQQNAFRSNVSKLMNLTKTNLIPSNQKIKTEDRHQPLHTTADASGKLLLMHYPSAVLFLSLDDPKEARWHRLDIELGDVESFDLSPDKSTLAIVNADGLRLLSVVPNDSLTAYSLVPIESGLPNPGSVVHFKWDKETAFVEPKGKWSFAYILKDSTVGHFNSGVDRVLGNLSEIQPSKVETDVKATHELKVSEITDLWFFKEVLVDETDPNKASKTLRYLALPYVEDSNKDEVKKVRFIKLDSLPPDEPTQYVDLDIGRNYTQVIPNEQGGVVVTGDNQGNVAVYLVSPFWGIANQVFDATSEADSPIECLSFIDESNAPDKMLIISNGNNHIFGLKTGTPKQTSN